MPELRPDQCAFFHEHGYLMVENAVDGALLKRLKQDFAAWVRKAGLAPPLGETPWTAGRASTSSRVTAQKSRASPGQCAGGGV